MKVKIYKKTTPLLIAILLGNLDIVQYLISEGANIECKTTKGLTPLHIASKKGHLDIIQYLISQGANINCRNNNFNIYQNP